MKKSPFVYLYLLLGLCLLESCSSSSHSEVMVGLGTSSNGCLFVDNNIEIKAHNDTCLGKSIYVVFDNFDIAKYHFLGEIIKRADTIQYVRLSVYFNIAESPRCNSKMLIYVNKKLTGYYLFSGDVFDFQIKDNNLICVLTTNPNCSTVLDFEPSKPRDWYIRFTDTTGDILPFEKFDTGSHYDYLPNTLMFDE